MRHSVWFVVVQERCVALHHLRCILTTRHYIRLFALHTQPPPPLRLPPPGVTSYPSSGCVVHICEDVGLFSSSLPSCCVHIYLLIECRWRSYKIITSSCHTINLSGSSLNDIMQWKLFTLSHLFCLLRFHLVLAWVLPFRKSLVHIFPGFWFT